MQELSDIVLPETAERILRLQPRCLPCGSTYALHIHHRIFRSEGEVGLQKLLDVASKLYLETYGKELERYHLHDIQNLVVLCNSCHEGQQVGVHGGNEGLRRRLSSSFTDYQTGWNIPFINPNYLKL